MLVIFSVINDLTGVKNPSHRSTSKMKYILWVLKSCTQSVHLIRYALLLYIINSANASWDQLIFLMDSIVCILIDARQDKQHVTWNNLNSLNKFNNQQLDQQLNNVTLFLSFFKQTVEACMHNSYITRRCRYDGSPIVGSKPPAFRKPHLFLRSTSVPGTKRTTRTGLWP